MRDNFVFVVTACPQSDRELQTFFGPEFSCSNKDVKIFSGLLSDRMFTGFLQMHRIRLCCLDAHSSPTNQNESESTAIYIPIQSLTLSHVPFSSVFSWYFKVPNSDSMVQNVTLCYKDQKLNEKICCNLHLIPFHGNSDLQPDEETSNSWHHDKLVVVGLSKNAPCDFERSVSYAVFPSDDGRYFLHVIKMLKRNKYSLVVQWQDKLGILQPLSSAACMCTMEIRMAAEHLSKSPSCANIGDGSFEVNGILKPVVDAAWKKLFGEYAEGNFSCDELDGASASPMLCSSVLENWCIPDLFELPGCVNEYRSMVDEENCILQCLQNFKSEAVNGDGDEFIGTDENVEPKEAPDKDKALQIVAKISTFSTRAELVESLSACYRDAVENDKPLIACAEEVVNVMKNWSKGKTHEEELTSVLETEIFRTLQDVNEKYKDDSDGKAGECKAHEYELQVLLRLNTMNQFSGDVLSEKFTPQIVEFLRMLMIYLKPPYVTQFLNETVLDRYPNVSQDAIRCIYDELMIPHPNDNSSDDDADLKSDVVTAHTLLNSSPQPDVSSSVEEQIQSSDLPTRTLPRPASFGGVTHKRQIVIPKFKKQKTENNLEKDRPRSKSDDCSGNSSNNNKKVCRNLLTKFGSTTSPRKHFHKKKYVLKTKTVMDTPIKKQVVNAAVHRQMRHRDKSLSVDSRMVIEETPEKSLRNAESDSSDFAPKRKAVKPVILFSLETAEPPVKIPSPEENVTVPPVLKTPIKVSTVKPVKIQPDEKSVLKVPTKFANVEPVKVPSPDANAAVPILKMPIKVSTVKPVKIDKNVVPSLKTPTKFANLETVEIPSPEENVTVSVPIKVSTAEPVKIPSPREKVPILKLPSKFANLAPVKISSPDENDTVPTLLAVSNVEPVKILSPDENDTVPTPLKVSNAEPVKILSPDESVTTLLILKTPTEVSNADPVKISSPDETATVLKMPPEVGNAESVICHELVPSPPLVASHEKPINLKRRHASWPQNCSLNGSATGIDGTPKMTLKRFHSVPTRLSQSAYDFRDSAFTIERIPSTPLHQGETSPSPVALEVPYEAEEKSNSNNSYPEVFYSSDSDFDASETSSPEIPQHTFNGAAVWEIWKDARESDGGDFHQSPKNCYGVEDFVAPLQNSNSVEARANSATDGNSKCNADTQLANSDEIKKVALFGNDISTTKSESSIPKVNSSAISDCFPLAEKTVSTQPTSLAVPSISNNNNNNNHSELDHSANCTTPNSALASPSSASLLHLTSSPVLYIHNNTPKRASSGHWKKRKL